MKHITANEIARIVGVLVVGSVAVCGTALAEDAGQDATSGSTSVMINGKPAQRLGDQAGAPGDTPGDASSNVMINGKPAAVNGKCPDGAIPTPSPNVFVEGKPAMFCDG